MTDLRNTTWYKREFEKWLHDFKNDDVKIFDEWMHKFKKTNVCDDEEFKEKCDKELRRMFREKIWEPMIMERIDREYREVEELLQKELLQKSYSVTEENIYEPVLFTKFD